MLRKRIADEYKVAQMQFRGFGYDKKQAREKFMKRWISQFKIFDQRDAEAYRKFKIELFRLEHTSLIKQTQLLEDKLMIAVLAQSMHQIFGRELAIAETRGNVLWRALTGAQDPKVIEFQQRNRGRFPMLLV